MVLVANEQRTDGLVAPSARYYYMFQWLLGKLHLLCMPSISVVFESQNTNLFTKLHELDEMESKRCVQLESVGSGLDYADDLRRWPPPRVIITSFYKLSTSGAVKRHYTNQKPILMIIHLLVNLREN